MTFEAHLARTIIDRQIPRRACERQQRVAQHQRAKVQMRGFRESPSIYALAELMASVNLVNVRITFDTVSVAVNVSNAVRQSTTISTTQCT